MITVKAGMFPGEIKNYIVENGASVSSVLELAGIAVGDEQEIKMNGNTVSLGSPVTDNALILVTKRLKGNK